MRTSHVIPVIALVIGVLLIIQGLLGIVAPDAFVKVIRLFQSPPMLYVAAALRIAIGIVLICAATGSRLPMFLRIFGVFVVIGGCSHRLWASSLRTPFLVSGPHKGVGGCGSLRYFP